MAEDPGYGHKNFLKKQDSKMIILWIKMIENRINNNNCGLLWHSGITVMLQVLFHWQVDVNVSDPTPSQVESSLQE